MDQETTMPTGGDPLWFQQPVTVQVEQDNRAWLDSLLEMNQEELINFGVYQYGIPEEAAKVVDRNGLISLIATANRAGGGQAVSRTEYIYIPELKGVIEPAVSLFDATSQPLYLTRGDGASRQVFDKTTNTWHNYDRLIAQERAKVDTQREAAATAARNVAAHESFNTTPPAQTLPPKQLLPVLSPATISMLNTTPPKRDILNEFAKELSIENYDDRENVSNKDLIDQIVKNNDANIAANQEG